MSKPPAHVFYVIIISQFCCTSLWFAVNAVLPQLQQLHQWPADALGHVTSAIQLGFISGTLIYAVVGVADRFSPALVFMLSSILASAMNALCLLDIASLNLALLSRLLTGFFLAGVYPVGMKIASDWNQQGLGHWLGGLVGALVLGSSFPHLLNMLPVIPDIKTVIITVSMLALAGGTCLRLLVGDGPHHLRSSRFSFRNVRGVFRLREFRAAAFGYFGHMWELYAFWAFIPLMLTFYRQESSAEFSVPGWSFAIIASGVAGCVIGGNISRTRGSKTVAAVALASSALCCLAAPVFFSLSFPLFISAMLFWGFMVVADSPQFSALVAANAPAHVRGAAITLTTCIGFAITIISIQLLNYLQMLISARYLLLVLAPGPLLGLWWLIRPNLQLWKKSSSTGHTVTPAN